MLNKFYFLLFIIFKYYSMNKSRIVEEQKVYVKFDDQGNTDLVKSNSFQPGFNYRRVHYTA